MAEIYEDFLESIALVRAGKDPEIAFRDHERRVHPIRMKIASMEARPVQMKLVS